MFTKIDYNTGHTAKLKIFQNPEILQSMFSSQNIINVKINTTKENRNSQWSSLNSRLPNKLQSKKDIIKIKIYFQLNDNKSCGLKLA